MDPHRVGRLRWWCLVGGVWFAFIAFVAPPGAAGALPPVEVSALRAAVAKSYRRITSGIDVFERRHALAPNAMLRFRLLPRRRDTAMEGIELRIVGDTVAIPVPVAADGTFVLPRSSLALQEDASVMPNRRVGSMTWRADIRTSGLPAGTRRLGDLRLECLVGLEAGLVSDTPTSLFDALARAIAERGYCEQREPHYLFFADRPLWSVTLRDGARRETLASGQLYAGSLTARLSHEELRHCDCEVLLDRTYYAPLGDPRWPDDTLVEFEYMDDGAGR